MRKYPLSELAKKHLKKIGFQSTQKEPVYVKIYLADALVILLYYLTSIVLILFEKADRIVLFLNILCLVRALFHCMIYSAEMTAKNTTKKKGPGIKNRKLHSYFYVKSGILLTANLILCGVLAGLIDRSDAYIDSQSLLLQFISSLIILFLLVDDLENILICAYKATI